MRRVLTPMLPNGCYLPDVAAEIARAAVADGFHFDVSSRGSKLGLERWATTYVRTMGPAEGHHAEEETPSPELQRTTDAYDRVIAIYENSSQRRIYKSKRPYVDPLIREHIIKQGYTDEVLEFAFRWLRLAGPAFTEPEAVFRNMPKVIRYATEAKNREQ